MSFSSNTSIAKTARAKAEAEFATWLMMAKLGGFDDLPSNAQGFLTDYQPFRAAVWMVPTIVAGNVAFISASTWPSRATASTMRRGHRPRYYRLQMQVSGRRLDIG
jgi:hypothetical protein